VQDPTGDGGQTKVQESVLLGHPPPPPLFPVSEQEKENDNRQRLSHTAATNVDTQKNMNSSGQTKCS